MPALPSSERLVWTASAGRSPRGVPLLRAVVAQAIAGVAVFTYMQVAPHAPMHPLLIQAVLAGIVGQALHLPLWWLPINAAFVPGVVAVNSLAIAPTWFLAAFAILSIVFWNTFRTRVPLYLSSRRACERLAQMLPLEANARVLDLGCGFGGVMVALRCLRPQLRLVGLELAPLPSWLAKLRLRRDAGSSVQRKDFWQEDFSAYDLVYAFLSPEPMEALWEKIRAQMRPGALFISNTFLIPGVPPDLTLPLTSSNTPALYVWRVRS